MTETQQLFHNFSQILKLIQVKQSLLAKNKKP